MSAPRLTLPDGRSIPYILKVSARRRTVGLRVDALGLTVHAPARLPLHAVESLLRDQSGWISGKLAEWQDRPAAPEWRDGTRLRHLGQPVQLCLRRDSRSRAAEFDGSRLHLAVADPQDARAVQRKVIQWYAGQARADFSRRLVLLAARLGVPAPPWRLSGARTRWGSCNARGEIRLNWRLIQAPPHVIHYVVAHELAHLKEMNHSPQFWAWVERLCPDYRAARQELKALSAHLHLL